MGGVEGGSWRLDGEGRRSTRERDEDTTAYVRKGTTVAGHPTDSRTTTRTKLRASRVVLRAAWHAEPPAGLVSEEEDSGPARPSAREVGASARGRGAGELSREGSTRRPRVRDHHRREWSEHEPAGPCGIAWRRIKDVVVDRRTKRDLACEEGLAGFADPPISSHRDVDLAYGIHPRLRLIDTIEMLTAAPGSHEGEPRPSRA